MKTFYLSGLSVALLVLFLASCLNDDRTIEPSSTIEEAKLWFENTVQQGKVEQNGKRKKDPPIPREPDWNHARLISFDNKQVVAVPLKFKETNRHNEGALNKLIISRDNNGKMELEVLKAIGNSSYLMQVNYKIGLQDFTGIVEVQDWDGNFITGEYYEHGKVIGTVGELKTSSDARTAGQWMTVYSDWYQQVCDVDGCSGWTYLDTFARVIYIADGQSPSTYYGYYYYEGGSGGSGGGNGGSGSSGCPYSPNCTDPVEPDYGEVLIDVEVVRPSDQSPNNLCGAYGFTSTGDGLTAEVLGLGGTAYNPSTNQMLFPYWGAMCVTFGSSSIVTSSAIGSQVFNQAWNETMNDAQGWLNTQQNPTTLQLSQFIVQTLRTNLGLFAEGYTTLSTGPCAGSVSSTVARYCN